MLPVLVYFWHMSHGRNHLLAAVSLFLLRVPYTKLNRSNVDGASHGCDIFCCAGCMLCCCPLFSGAISFVRVASFLSWSWLFVPFVRAFSVVL